MFFWASKVFWLLAQPLSLVFLLMTLGVLALWWRRKGLATSCLVLALLVHGVVSFTNLGYLIIQPLEDRFAMPATPPEVVDAIIMLGGATLERPSSARQTAELNDAGDRLTTTLWLARAYPDARIFLSGGGGPLTEDGEAEATTAERFFLAFGIEPARLVLEPTSRNTAENVANTKGLLGESGNGTIVLVTSAFHMPRSVGIFEKAGLSVIPWPTDYRSPGPQGFGFDVANPVQNLNVSTMAIKEWVGLLIYSWTGKTSALLPGP